MAHATLVPQTLEKSDKKHDYNTISKKFVTTPRSTKSSPTTSKVSPSSAPDRLTMQGIISASLLKSTRQKFVLSDTLERILCREKQTLWQSYS